MPILLPSDEREGMLLMLRAYFDDSGSHADSEIVTIGGLVGTVAQWTEFDDRWKALLAEPLPGKPRLVPIHKQQFLQRCKGQE